jgi:hypothetical protein
MRFKMDEISNAERTVATNQVEIKYTQDPFQYV